MKILVVDDEPAVERLFTLRFRKESRSGKVELVFAHSGSEALAYLEENNSLELAFILADINMPQMNGFELLEKLRDRYPQKKIFMVTAYDDQLNRSRAIELGATEYLVKPIDFKKLKEKIFFSNY